MDDTNSEDAILREIEKRRKDNDDAVNKILKAILRKSKDALTREDIGFLKARVSYLSETDRENYKDVLALDPGSVAAASLDEMTRKELDTQAMEAGVADPDKLPNRQSVIDAIREAQNK